jgi:osmotically-inducible protein OsmY
MTHNESGHRRKEVSMRTLHTMTTLTAAGAACAIVAPAPAQPADMTDRRITLAVETELALDAATPAHRIDVAAEDAMVTLTGSVDTLLAKQRAETVAGAVAGVREVFNTITVKPTERADDAVRADVRAALVADPAAEAFDLTTTVNDGAVTLRGTVESAAERMLAERVASAVRGVTAVDASAVEVDPPESRPDAQIIADVQRMLASSALVDDASLDVAVDEGVVTLSGAVGSPIERQRAVRLAAVTGAVAVRSDQVEVQPWARADMINWSARSAAGDDHTEGAIESSWMQRPRLRAAGLEAFVSDGVATITGTVDNLRARQVAESVALHTVGVRRVKNHVKVRPDNAPTTPMIEQSIREALQRDPYTNRLDFDVNVVNGQARLTGTVGSTFEKHRAARVVEGVFGVTEVINETEATHEWTWKPDWEIQEDVRSQLFWSPFVDSDQIEITVEGGVVELTGRVESWNEKMDAGRNAYDGGAKDVRNRIKVDPNA